MLILYPTINAERMRLTPGSKTGLMISISETFVNSKRALKVKTPGFKLQSYGNYKEFRADILFWVFFNNLIHLTSKICQVI